MNYLMTLLTPDNTGGARVALEYAAALVARGNNVTVAHGSIAVAPERCNEYLAELTSKGVKLVEEPGLSQPFLNESVKRLVRYGRDNDVHCVIGVNQRDRVAAVAIARKLNVRSVICGLNQHSFSGSFILSFLKKIVYKFWMQRADLIVCSSNEVLDEYVTEFGVDRERTELLPHGISLKSITSDLCDPELLKKEFGFPEDSIVVVNVGRIDRQKGQDILLEALGVAENKDRYRLILVGAVQKDSSEAENMVYQEHLESIARRHKIAGNVVFAGWRDDYIRLIASSDLYCHPARYEGLPLVVLSALAARVPVVVSNNAASPPGFVDERHGLLVDIEDSNDLKNKLNLLQGMSPKSKTNLSNEGRALVETRYDMDTIGLRFCELANNLLKQ